MSKAAVFGLILLPLSVFAFSSKFLPGYDIQTRCDKILHKTAFDICYSCKWKTPRMVVYRIDGKLADGVNLSRKHLYFRPDYRLPAKCRSYPKDYSRTGFDRGHLAPNAAFDYSKRVQKETFLMSNIAPQKPRLNRRLWAKIERFARFQARKYETVSVITGVCGSQGYIRNGVNVPRYWFKIIFRPRKTPVCFLAPNTNKGMSRAKAKEFLSSMNEIERECGFSFFRND